MSVRVALVLLWTVATGCASAGAPGSDGDDLPDLYEPRDDEPLAFSHPDACEACHEEHVREWRMTPHAYAAVDPVFRAMVRMGQAQTEGKLGQFCIQCHSPTGLATEQTPVFYNEDAGRFEQNLELDPIAMSGVTCTACHSITNVVEPLNARVVYTPDGTMRGPIRDPVENEFHASTYSELFDDQQSSFGSLCGSCHNVTSPKGALVEQTFREFAASDMAARGTDCATCHMPEYQGKAAVGPDAPDVPERTLHRHTFVGVDVSLLPEGEFPGDQEMRDLSEKLLQESANFSLALSGTTLEASIENLAGHALPSGATAERQMWIELLIRDAEGNIVFASGTLDANGDLRDGIAAHNSEAGSDPQLAYYGQVMVAIEGFVDMSDAEKLAARQRVDASCIPFARGAVAADAGAHPVEMPWQADWQCDNLVPVESTAVHSYDLSQLPPGTYSARARLLFRSFPPFFLKILEDEAGLDPALKERVPIVEMEVANLPLDL